ncbi:hypothetical protein [Paenibacillus sp. GCM10012306]|uniref:hypothetical protein n=1 Tax=Paenibacillus sp. GCM10012306 TaxID=3317342 RepID=UPI003619DB95
MAKLTTAKINKINKELDKKRKIYILEDNDEVNISVTFKDAVVDKLVLDYISILEEVSKSSELTDEIIRGTIAVLNLLILREFSDVPTISKKVVEIQKLIDITYVLYNTGIMDAVMEQFDPAQVKKVHEKLEKVSKRAGELIGEMAIRATLDDAKNEELS